MTVKPTPKILYGDLYPITHKFFIAHIFKHNYVYKKKKYINAPPSTYCKMSGAMVIFSINKRCL